MAEDLSQRREGPEGEGKGGHDSFSTTDSGKHQHMAARASCACASTSASRSIPTISDKSWQTGNDNYANLSTVN